MHSYSWPRRSRRRIPVHTDSTSKAFCCPTLFRVVLFSAPSLRPDLEAPRGIWTPSPVLQGQTGGSSPVRSRAAGHLSWPWLGPATRAQYLTGPGSLPPRGSKPSGCAGQQGHCGRENALADSTEVRITVCINENAITDTYQCGQPHSSASRMALKNGAGRGQAVCKRRDRLSTLGQGHSDHLAETV